MLWTTGTSAYQGLPLAMDPLADWIRPESRPADHRILVLIRLAAGITAQDLPDFPGSTETGPVFVFNGKPVTHRLWQQALVVPRCYTGARGPWNRARYCTALATPDFFQWLLAEPKVQALFDEITLCITPDVSQSPADDFEAGAAIDYSLPQATVVTGVIDYGLPLANPLYSGLAPDGAAVTPPRLLSVWVQDGSPVRASAHNGLSRPDEFRYGAELSATAIRRLLRRSGGDEDRFYRKAALFLPTRLGTYWTQHTTTHGAHILGTVIDPASDPGRHPVIAVQLPSVAVEDRTGASLSGHAVDALRFIIARTEDLSDPEDGRQIPPLVINLSYGFHAGPHDGNAPIEKAMTELHTLWSGVYPAAPFVIVVPAGNAYQSSTHACWTAAMLAAGQTSVTWEIMPDDASCNILQVWLPEGLAGGATARLTSPQGQTVQLSTASTGLARLAGGAHPPAAMASYCPPHPARPRGLFQFVVGATASGTPGRASSGLWTVTIDAPGLTASQRIEAWVQRDDGPPVTGRIGRQSILHHPAYRPIDPPRQPGDGTVESGPVMRPGAFNALATGPATVVAGACYRQPLAGPGSAAVSFYSGGGRSGWPAGVDLLAPSDDSLLLLGRLGLGMRAAGSARMFGTSVAAAMVTRRIGQSITSFVGLPPKAGASALVTPPPAPAPDPRGGYGRLA